MTYSSSLTVLEVSAAGGTGRQLVLTGGGLPHMGAEWAMKVNAPTTWYPGNGDEATQQVLCPQELPSRWTGDWRRTTLGRSPARYTDENGGRFELVAPDDLREVFELMARGGARLRVIWSVENFLDETGRGRLVREGRITEAKFKYARIQDVEWEIEFTWVGRGGTAARATSTRAATVAGDSAAYAATLNALLDANARASLQRFKPSSLTLGQLEALADYPSALTNSLARQVQQIGNSVDSVIAIAKTLAAQPLQVANRATGLARDTVARVNSFRDQIGQIPYELRTKKTRLADVARAARAFNDQARAAGACARAGQDFLTRLQSQLQALDNAALVRPSRLGAAALATRTYVTVSGDTPARVSQRLFGSPDHAVDLLRANHLPWHTPAFRPGQVLVVPAVGATPSTRST